VNSRLARLVLGIFLAACGAELVLHAFPVSTGYHLGAVNASRPIPLGEPHSRYTYSRDWNFRLHNSGVLNNYGLRSSYDYRPDPRAVVVVGNSYVQADALDPRDTLQERLGDILHRPVYGLGVDGFSLADYLAASRWAAATFDARTLVVLLTTGDLDHSCSRRSGQHYLRFAGDEISLALVERDSPSRLKRRLNQSQLFRYLFDNLRVTANWSKGWRRDRGGDSSGPGAAEAGCADARFEAAATKFLLSSFLELEAGRHLRIAFLLAPGYRREQSLEPGAIRDVDRFADDAERAGFPIVRLQTAFAQALAAGTRLDFLPIDGHWNAYAHAIAAEVLAGALLRDQPPAGSMTRINSPALRSE
jgi:hypothetical protein